MIVTGALCWWKERPGDLEACVRGLGTIADRIVALDGSYRRYPGATITSSKKELDAIRSTAREIGLDCLILQPDRLWAGQVEKRSYLLNAAAVGTDWIVTVDTDHVISASREAVRAQLAQDLSTDAWDVPFYTPIPSDRPVAESAPGQWHIEQAGTTVYIPQVWRAHPGFLVEERHWWISAVKAGQRIWMWGGDGRYPQSVHSRFSAPYGVEHRCLFRTREQILASRGFCNDRVMVVERTGQEDDVPGLPEPVWDVERMLV